MFLTETKSGNKVEALIEPLAHGDFKMIKRSRMFPNFKWDAEKRNEVVKIRLKNSNEILGLMSLTDFKSELWILINLLQSSKDNAGAGKKYEGIAGCLIAYACRQAFKRGYDGTVALEPKTELAKYYTQKYGMKPFGVHLYTTLENSERLIEEYLN